MSESVNPVALIAFAILSGLWQIVYHVTGDPVFGAVVFPWLYAAVIFTAYNMINESRKKDK